MNINAVRWDSGTKHCMLEFTVLTNQYSNRSCQLVSCRSAVAEFGQKKSSKFSCCVFVFEFCNSCRIYRRNTFWFLRAGSSYSSFFEWNRKTDLKRPRKSAKRTSKHGPRSKSSIFIGEGQRSKEP